MKKLLTYIYNKVSVRADSCRGVRLCVCLMLPMVAFLLVACSVSYKFNGASIDYSKTKTIQIADFPIRSTYVWGPMGPMFNNELKDMFARHTKLQQVRRNGDLKIEGEITQYQQRNKSVSSEGASNQVYDSNMSLNSVQEELVENMVKDIVDQIFNATVANW